jgi:hypothetical protein
METLARIVLDLLLFLELSDDSTVDPDAAVTQMESVAANLQALAPNDRGQFVALTEQYADEREPGRDRDFLRALPAAWVSNRAEEPIPSRASAAPLRRLGANRGQGGYGGASPQPH